jgi:hypothetical protein
MANLQVPATGILHPVNSRTTSTHLFLRCGQKRLFPLGTLQSHREIAALSKARYGASWSNVCWYCVAGPLP